MFVFPNFVFASDGSSIKSFQCCIYFELDVFTGPASCLEWGW